MSVCLLEIRQLEVGTLGELCFIVVLRGGLWVMEFGNRQVEGFRGDFRHLVHEMGKKCLSVCLCVTRVTRHA